MPEVSNTLAYYVTVLIIQVKSFIVHTHQPPNMNILGQLFASTEKLSSLLHIGVILVH